VTVSDRGTGQGSVISPLLANIYLRYVFDLYAERWRRREDAGDMIFVRYADDFIVGFQYETDTGRDARAVKGVCADTASREDPVDRVRAFCSQRPQTADLANRKPSTSWASPSSVVNPARVNSNSYGRPGGTACGAKLRMVKEESRSPNRGNGCAMFCAAT
jgi:Reverse transcriptase (RNA-dependent DNA polymerase)